MKNSIICSNCGMENENNSKFCGNCGAQLIEEKTELNIVNTENVNVQQNVNSSVDSNLENNVIDSDTKAGNKLGILALLLYFAAPTLVQSILMLFPEKIAITFSTLIGICPPVGLVLMIVGRIKYPNNKLLKIAMWVIIASIILSIVAVIVFMIACYVMCGQYDTSGCG